MAAGRTPVLLAVFLVLTVLLTAHFGADNSWAQSWRMLLVPGMDPTFADARMVTTALDCVRQGVDPYVQNLCDPWLRKYNYPRAMLYLAKTGVGARHTELVGCVIALLVVGTFLLLVDVRRLLSGACVFLMLVSPPLLLGIERGNTDLLIFGLFVFVFAATSRAAPGFSAFVRSGVIVLLTAVKMYPIAIVAALVRSRLTFAMALVVSAVAIGALLLTLQPGDLGRVIGNTPQVVRNSFGSAVIPYGIAKAVAPTADLRGVRMLGSLCAVALTAGVALWTFRRGPLFGGFLPRLIAGRMCDDIALACLAVFAFAFVAGSNYDYRLIFLIGATPPLLRLYDARPSIATAIAPVIVVCFLWLSHFTLAILFADELFAWILFLGAVAWLGTTIFERVQVGTGGRSVTSRDAAPPAVPPVQATRP